MRGAQLVIKYFAIAFAVALVVGIFAAIAGAGTMMSYVFGGYTVDNSDWTEEVISDEWGFRELAIEVEATNVRIEPGEKFQVLADSEVIEFRRSGDRLYIEEKDFGWFQKWHKVGGEVKILLPEEGMNLAKLTLEGGAGTIYMDGVIAEKLDLNLGVGRTELRNLTVTEKAKIDGGAGLLVIQGAELADLDMDMGVGKVEMEAELIGNGKISAGLGKLELKLKGGQDDYRMSLGKGLGSITVNGTEMTDGAVWGNGARKIGIDGGVGAIEIVTE